MTSKTVEPPEESKADSRLEILFVCTGNICRSPLAEALARGRVVSELGMSGLELERRGVSFTSAGLAAWPGSAATRETRRVAAGHGLDLDGHSATRLTPEMIRSARRIFVMTPRQIGGVLSLEPASEERVTTLRRDGGAIRDPYGRRQAAYETTYQTVAEAVEERLAEIVGLARAHLRL